MWFFTQVEDMRLWYGAKFYGPESRQYKALIRITGLSHEQLDKLFDETTGLFGTALVSVRGTLKTFFNCNGNLCSENEIAQW